MRITPMKKIREVLELHVKIKLSARKIQSIVGVPRSTVLDYISRLKKSDININELDSLDDEQLKAKLFGSKTSTPKYKKPLPNYNYIYNEYLKLFKSIKNLDY